MDFRVSSFQSVWQEAVWWAVCLIGLAILPAVAEAQNFGSVDIGTTTTTAVTVTMQSAGTLGSILVVTKGAPNLDFTDGGSDTCATGTSYVVGATCTVHVTFKPRYPGPRYGAVELLTSSDALLATTYVQGIGVGPQAVFANSSRVGVYQPSAHSRLLSGSSCSEYPYGLALDGSGNIFGTSGNQNSVFEILAAGGYTTCDRSWSGRGYPGSIAVDGGGNVFYLGNSPLYGNAAPSPLYEIVAAGGYTTFHNLRTLWATGIAVDGSGNLFVTGGTSGTNLSMVYEILAAGGYTTMNTVATGFGNLSAIAVDGSGDLFVADENTKTVDEIMAVNGYIPASPTIKTIGSGYSKPDGVAVDASGNVFVADFAGNAVYEILAASGYAQSITLYRWSSSPYAVAVDERGNVFIAPFDDWAQELDYADPPSFSFASTQEGVLSGDSPQTVTVANDGNAALTFQVPSSGDNPSLSSSFLLASDSTCEQTTSASSSAFTLAEGENCTLAIDFKPETYGAISGSAVLTDNSLNVAGATQTIALSGAGEGSGPLVQLSASSLSFGSVDVGTYGAYQSVTVSNVGNAAVTISSIALTGTNASQFLFENNCGTSLAVGAGCTIEGQFGPTSTGAKTAAVTITDNAGGSPQTISLSGTGLPPPVTLSATSLSYGSVVENTTSASQTVVMTNEGTAALSISSINLSGTGASSFVFANSCGASLAAGATCAIHGHFAPTTSGAMTATITITDSAATSPQTIALSGTGVPPPVVSLTSTSLAFGSVTENTAAESQTVTLTNTGGSALVISSIAITGTNASEFVFANDCGTSLAAGSSCTVHGHFAPTALGSASASITITDNAQINSPQAISLTGTGVAATSGVTLSATSLPAGSTPTNLVFGSVVVGSTSPSDVVTLTNTGSSTLSITSIAVTGANASQFVFSNSCASNLAAGTSCNIQGHFAPTAVGSMTATIKITDSDATSLQTIALSGAGLAASGTATLSASSLSFPLTTAGMASGSQSVSLTNTGSGLLTISSIAVTGADPSSFVFANSCGASLAVGASCTIHGHFAPVSSGAQTAAVTIIDSAIGSPQSISLSGTGH